MGRIAIAGYKPKPGKSDALKKLMRSHVDILRSRDLVTDRRPIVMEAADGTIVEVFEWASREAIEAAHSDPVVGEMWREYDAACDYVPIGSVPEAAELFSEFTPLDVD